MKVRFYKIRSRTLACLVVAILASCMVGKPYERPDLRLPAAITAGVQDSSTWADRAWWEVYADPPLRELIGKALDHNKEMQIAAARIREAAAQRRIRTASLLPQISAYAEGERERENYRGNGASNADEFSVKAGLNWEIDLWGKLRWDRKRSIAEYLETVEAQRALQMTLVAEVAEAYFELVALDNELSIVRQTLLTRQEGVEQARLRFEGGLTSETSYQQAQVELATTASLIPELEHRIEVKQHEIAWLAGDYPSIVARGTMDQEIPMPRELPVGLPSDLLRRRPDVRQAEETLKAAHAAVGVAYTDRFPQLTISAAFGVENDRLSSLFQSPYSLLNGVVAGPVFGFGKKRAQYRAAQAACEAARLRYEQTVLTVFREVNDALGYYNSIREACQLKRNLERAARKYVDLARLQYLNGVINYLDVLDAQRRYFDAQIGLSNAVRDEHIALVQLYKALGGGWNV